MKKRVLQNNGDVCKDCRFFKTNPGRCNFNNVYIARKHPACTEFKHKKGGK